MDETQAHLKFLGLREQPFAPTADPVYFYATHAHKECLFRLWSSIDSRHGIAVVLESNLVLRESYREFFVAFELFSVLIFSVEYIARLWAATEKPRYAGLSPLRARLRYAL